MQKANDGDASDFARLFRIPGMDHCRRGPATDQFDAISALVKWVEQGQAPDQIIASVRGAGNAGGQIEDLPAEWSPNRARPLCPYPAVAIYKGSGDIEGEQFRLQVKRDDVSLCSAIDGSLCRRQWVNDQSLARLHFWFT